MMQINNHVPKTFIALREFSYVDVCVLFSDRFLVSDLFILF